MSATRAPGFDITIIGNLTADPELRFTAAGHAVANFTIAHNERYQDKASGEWVEKEPTFVRCSAWRGLAENVAESLSRGDRVIVRGSLAPRKFTNNDGVEVTVWDLDAREVGASLSFATAKVSKVSRGNGGGNGGAAQGSNNGATEEPPF